MHKRIPFLNQMKLLKWLYANLDFHVRFVFFFLLMI